MCLNLQKQRWDLDKPELTQFSPLRPLWLPLTKEHWERHCVMLLKVFGITWVDTWHGANSFITQLFSFTEIVWCDIQCVCLWWCVFKCFCVRNLKLCIRIKSESVSFGAWEWREREIERERKESAMERKSSLLLAPSHIITQWYIVLSPHDTLHYIVHQQYVTYKKNVHLLDAVPWPVVQVDECRGCGERERKGFVDKSPHLP